MYRRYRRSKKSYIFQNVLNFLRQKICQAPNSEIYFRPITPKPHRDTIWEQCILTYLWGNILTRFMRGYPWRYIEILYIRCSMEWFMPGVSSIFHRHLHVYTNRTATALNSNALVVYRYILFCWTSHPYWLYILFTMPINELVLYQLNIKLYTASKMNIPTTKYPPCMDTPPP